MEDKVNIAIVDEVPEDGDANTIYIHTTNMVNEDDTFTPIIKAYVFQGGFCWDISPEDEREKEEFNRMLEEAGLELRV